MATDRQILKSIQKGQCDASSMSDPAGEVAKANRRTLIFQVKDNADVDAANPEFAVRMAVAGKVISSHVTAPIAVTGHDTNNAVFTLAKRTGAGSATTIAALTTTATPANSLVAFVPFEMTLTASAAAYAAGDVLTVKLTKGSAGVAVCAADAATVINSTATITVVVEED